MFPTEMTDFCLFTPPFSIRPSFSCLNSVDWSGHFDSLEHCRRGLPVERIQLESIIPKREKILFASGVSPSVLLLDFLDPGVRDLSAHSPGNVHISRAVRESRPVPSLRPRETRPFFFQPGNTMRFGNQLVSDPRFP
jgi:hypothetical protein